MLISAFDSKYIARQKTHVVSLLVRQKALQRRRHAIMTLHPLSGLSRLSQVAWTRFLRTDMPGMNASSVSIQPLQPRSTVCRLPIQGQWKIQTGGGANPESRQLGCKPKLTVIGSSKNGRNLPLRFLTSVSSHELNFRVGPGIATKTGLAKW